MTRPSKEMSLHESVAGGFAGFCQVMVGHPFDTIKVRMQTQTESRGALKTLSTLLKKESVSALYKGVQSPLLGIAFCNSVLFTANGFFQGLLLSDSTPHHLQLDRVTAAGMASGAVMALVNCPVELLKVRLQIQDHSRESQRYRGLLDCARQTVKADGPWGLYRGFGATLLRDLPSFAAYFATYEAVKAQFPSTSSPAALIISGGMAGIAAWLPCYPQDVLKSRIQSAASPSTSLLQAVSALSREAGMRGFWKGFGPTMLRAFPANAATFLGYEFAMRHLDSLKVIEA